MEFLNIGIPELLIILLLMLIFLGPEGMVKTARTIARETRKFIRSPLWADLVKAQRDIHELPTRLVREAGIEDLKKELEETGKMAHVEVPSRFNLKDEAPIELQVGPYPQVVPPQENEIPEEEIVIRPPKTSIPRNGHKQDEDLP